MNAHSPAADAPSVPTDPGAGPSTDVIRPTELLDPTELPTREMPLRDAVSDAVALIPEASLEPPPAEPMHDVAPLPAMPVELPKSGPPAPPAAKEALPIPRPRPTLRRSAFPLAPPSHQARSGPRPLRPNKVIRTSRSRIREL